MEELIETGLEMKRPEDLEEAYRLIKMALVCSKQFGAKAFHGNSGANIRGGLGDNGSSVRMDTSFCPIRSLFEAQQRYHSIRC